MEKHIKEWTESHQKIIDVAYKELQRNSERMRELFVSSPLQEYAVYQQTIKNILSYDPLTNNTRNN